MNRKLLALFTSAALFSAISNSFGGDKAEAQGDPVLGMPTLHSLGVHWIVKGDENKNAVVTLDYRKKGGSEWTKGMPLFRNYRDKIEGKERGSYKSSVKLPDDAWLFAGSALMLTPETDYQLRLKLTDPDGGEAEKIFDARTTGEPVAPKGPVRHVVPGDSGGTGTEADPFKGIKAAHAAAEPGDTMLLHAGVYEGEIVINKSGEPNKPIIWRGQGEAVLDFKGKADKRPGRGITAADVHDVWFEGLTMKNADHAIVAHDSSRLVVRRCNMSDVDFGFTGTRNQRDQVSGFFISDNVMQGPSTWPRTPEKGIEDARGIQVSGQGHVICYNRVRGFGDAIDTFPSGRVENIDIHNNDVSELTDDGIEADYSERNVRVFHNRLTNVYQGITVQPLFGGPVYIFRNTIYNIGIEPFKMHNSPSGALMFHNTTVKESIPIMVYTPAPSYNCVFRNNLFVGGGGSFALDFDTPMRDCDFDYDGIVGGPFKQFLRWNKVRYDTFEDMKAKAPIEKHAVFVDDASKVFAADTKVPQKWQEEHKVGADLRLKAGSPVIDAGEVIPGLNDGFKGKAPDLGAFEQGEELPHYGPRPLK